jgi:hypothetical protein
MEGGVCINYGGFYPLTNGDMSAQCPNNMGPECGASGLLDLCEIPDYQVPEGAMVVHSCSTESNCPVGYGWRSEVGDDNVLQCNKFSVFPEQMLPVRVGHQEGASCISCPPVYRDQAQEHDHGFNIDRVASCTHCEFDYIPADENNQAGTLFNLAHFAPTQKECRNVEGMNPGVEIVAAYMNCVDTGLCTASVDISHSLAQTERVFLSMKLAGHDGQKARVGQDFFPLYWFELGPDLPSPHTVEMTGQLPFNVGEFKSIRIKLKRGKKDTLACKVFTDIPREDEDEDEDEA